MRVYRQIYSILGPRIPADVCMDEYRNMKAHSVSRKNPARKGPSFIFCCLPKLLERLSHSLSTSLGTTPDAIHSRLFIWKLWKNKAGRWISFDKDPCPQEYKKNTR